MCLHHLLKSKTLQPLEISIHCNKKITSNKISTREALQCVIKDNKVYFRHTAKLLEWRFKLTEVNFTKTCIALKTFDNDNNKCFQINLLM